MTITTTNVNADNNTLATAAPVGTPLQHGNKGSPSSYAGSHRLRSPTASGSPSFRAIGALGNCFNR